MLTAPCHYYIAIFLSFSALLLLRDSSLMSKEIPLTPIKEKLISK